MCVYVKKTTSGFTLIEMIGVLVLVSITGLILTAYLSPLLQRYIRESEALVSAQSMQVAMSRIRKEIKWSDPATLTAVDAGRTLQWTSRHPNLSGLGTRSLTWDGVNGGSLSIDSNTLLEGVAAFSVSITGSQHVSLSLNLADQPANVSTTLSSSAANDLVN